MKVLIACEFSGIVRDAFLARGHDATSCDLLPSERPGPHHQGEVEDILEDGWEMMIAFPPCTYLCSSGLHWNGRVEGRDELTHEAMLFVFSLIDAPIPRIAIENPVGCISTNYRKPDQIIQPWQFGHPESKKTCLWLKGLPLLRPTRILTRPAWVKCPCCENYLCTIHKMHAHDCPCPEIEEWDVDPYTAGGPTARGWDNQTPSGQNRLGPSDTRAMERSRTYQGIADAMADQWSSPFTGRLF